MMLENILEDTVDHSLGASLSLFLSLHLLGNHEFNCNYDLKNKYFIFFNLFIVMQLFGLGT